MLRPETKYVKTPGGYVGYQVFGKGEIDLLFISSWTSNLDIMWEFPAVVNYFNQLASFSRVICFDKRGTGVSDPIPLTAIPTLEEWMDDAREVLDVVGVDQVLVIGDGEGGFMANLFAATYSRRVTGLVLINSVPRWRREDGYAIGYPDQPAEKILQQLEQFWGTGTILQLTAPDMAENQIFREKFARYERLSLSPGAAVNLYRWVMSLDVRSVLPSISCPVLILHRGSNNHYRLRYAEYMHQVIENSRLVVLKGGECHPFFAGDLDPVLAEIRKFLSVSEELKPVSRELATIMFTDIVDSTRKAANMGDHQWIEKLEAHNALIRTTLPTFRGKEVETTGDGFLITFDGPARAIQCAKSIRDGLNAMDLRVRIGLHSGELEFHKEGASGIALHLASRIMSTAQGNEIRVSRTVKDLVIGAGIDFSYMGEFELKGIPDKWQLFSVAN